MTPQDVTQWAREFGVMVAVLFLVLFTGIAFMWFLVAKMSRVIEEVKETLVLHAKGTEPALNTIQTIRQEVESFRASERDCLANLREALSIHSKTCDNGNTKAFELMKDVSADIDAIGKSVEKLVNVLTYRRRKDDDADRQG